MPINAEFVLTGITSSLTYSPFTATVGSKTLYMHSMSLYKGDVLVNQKYVVTVEEHGRPPVDAERNEYYDLEEAKQDTKTRLLTLIDEWKV